MSPHPVTGPEPLARWAARDLRCRRASERASENDFKKPRPGPASAATAPWNPAPQRGGGREGNGTSPEALAQPPPHKSEAAIAAPRRLFT